MTQSNGLRRAQELEHEIRQSADTASGALVSDFLLILHDLERQGAEIPGSMRGLRDLMEERATEDLFDNMPV